MLSIFRWFTSARRLPLRGCRGAEGTMALRKVDGLLTAHQPVGAYAADLRVVGEAEGHIGVEELVEFFLQQSNESVAVNTDICYGLLVHRDGGVVVLYLCALDEEQGGAHLVVVGVVSEVVLGLDNAIEHGLEDVVGVLAGDILRPEHIVDSSDIACRARAGLIVDDT